MNIRRLVSFDTMITPTIIKVLFWIGTVVSVLVGLGLIVSGLGSNYGGGFQVFIGLITIVLGPVMVRVYCELLILFFKIFDRLGEVKSALERPKKEARVTGDGTARQTIPGQR